jgi:hypothetical protein
MTMLTDLADACRKSGLPVVEVDGWRTRGHGQFAGVNSIVCHHTATAKTAAGDYPSLRIVRDGRSDLPGPLSQLGLGRSGTVYVIAAGVAWHAGATFFPRQDNWHSIGIEAEHDGLSPWTPEQRDAYVRLVAALRDHYGIPLSNIQGHKEVAKPLGRKPDPTFDMTAFRADVQGLAKRDQRLAKLAKAKVRGAKWKRWLDRNRKFRARLRKTLRGD